MSREVKGMKEPFASYQACNSSAVEEIDRRHYEDFTFVAHFHARPELVYVTEGELEVTIDGTAQRMQPGQYCLVLPWQIHAYDTPAHSRSAVMVFPERYIAAFLRDMSARHGVTQIFEADAPIHQLFLQYLYDGAWPDEYLLSSILLGLCHCFVSRCEIIPNADARRTAVLVRMMDYVSDHYREDLSLRDVADALGYSYYYLSHLFSRYAGLSFQQFRNLKRIEHAQYELAATQMSISSIAYECGFSCVRSFNRVFRELAGMSPAEYRMARARNRVQPADDAVFKHMSVQKNEEMKE